MDFVYTLIQAANDGGVLHDSTLLEAENSYSNTIECKTCDDDQLLAAKTATASLEAIHAGCLCLK